MHVNRRVCGSFHIRPVHAILFSKFSFRFCFFFQFVTLFVHLKNRNFHFACSSLFEPISDASVYNLHVSILSLNLKDSNAQSKISVKHKNGFAKNVGSKIRKTKEHKKSIIFNHCAFHCSFLSAVGAA